MNLVLWSAKEGCLVAALLFLAACSGGDSDSGGTPSLPSTPVPGPALTTVSVAAPAGASTTLSPGQTLQFTASPRDQNGAAIAASVAWSSSASAVAMVSPAGLVTAVAAGSATITAVATAGTATATGTATVTVQAPPPVLTSVSITPATTSLQAGQTIQFSAGALDQSGNSLPATISWATSASTVASVSQAGLVTALAAGTVVISAQATAAGVTLTATRSLTVAAVTPVLTTVTISAPATSVTVGQTLQLTAVPRDQNGAAIAATVAWSSSITARATVSTTGLVTAVAAGSVTITAVATSGTVNVTGNVGLTVQAPLVLTSVALSGPSTTVAAGATLQLTASPRDQNGSPIQGATVAWSSSATGVASVTAATGLVTGVSAGNANITALATLGSATASSFITISVTAAFASSANVTTPGNSFDPSSVDIAVGGTVTWTLGSAHNVTFNGGSGAPANIGVVNSDSRTFNVAGTFGYSCTIHSGMTGQVVVH